MQHFGRILGFTLIPIFGIVTPLIALPAITGQFGATAWAAIAVSTAVGGMISAAVELGWSWNGPMRVARASLFGRRRHLAWATSSRVLVLVPLAVIGGLIAYAIAPDYRVESSLVAIAVAAGGLNTSWFFVGIGRPWRIVYLDALPRMCCVAAAALMLHGGEELWVYPALGLLLPSLGVPTLALVIAGVRLRDFHGQSLRRLGVVIRAQARVTTARVVSTTYMQLPVILVAGVASVGQVALFAGGDRLARMALSGAAPIPNMFQRWVGAAPRRADRLKRAFRAVGVNVGLGIALGLAFLWGAPLAAQFVFSGTVSIALLDAAILAGMISVVVVSRSVGGIALVAAGGQMGLLTSAIAGAVVGLPLIPTLALAGGATGAFLGVLLSELAVLTVQTFAVARALRTGTAS